MQTPNWLLSTLVTGRAEQQLGNLVLGVAVRR
jgi:hypothetical protein